MAQEEQQAANGNQQEASGSTFFGNVTGQIHTSAGDIVIRFTANSDEAAEQYLEYVLSLILRYDKQAFRRKLIHNGLQLTIFIGAAAATILVSFSKIIPGVLTGIVTVSTAVANYYKFGDHSRYLELVAEDLALEYNRFKTKRGIYKNKAPEETLPLFMDRVESLILEQRQHSAALEQLKETQK